MKLKINLENCYGIKKLSTEFNFEEGNVQLIYAGNGVMKSSFAKTFQEFSLGKDPADNFFPNRISKFSIQDEIGNDISREEIFVINPPTLKQQSDKESLLLVNQSLKEEYESLVKKFKNQREDFEKDLKKNSRFKGDLNQELAYVFNIEGDDELTFYEKLKDIVEKQENFQLDKIAYSDIFNSDVEKFLGAPGVKEQIASYVSKFEELVTKSNYFKMDFNHINASQVAESLKGNNFFKVKNEIVLNNNGQKQSVTKIEDLEKIFQEEKEAIFQNAELQERFSEIDLLLEKNAGLRKFRTFINENKWIVKELSDLKLLKFKFWSDFLKISLTKIQLIIDVGIPAQNRITEIIDQAKKESTEWRNVVDTFNRRFSLPYTLAVVNQDKVMLNSDAPSLRFTFIDGDDESVVTEDVLEKNISTGERKAWFILNILFEIEARRRLNSQCFLIIDDIADSFDYKNKYAIIEYLFEISKYPNFKMIILTHNFDFFRTVSRRLNLNRKNCFMPIKTSTEVRLCEAAYFEDPLKYWKNHCSTNIKFFLSMIAMVRNLIGYSYGEDSDNYKKLTSLLHHKNDTEDIFANEIVEIFNTVIDTELRSYEENFKVFEKIIEVADEIEREEGETVNLENKVILSFAIRLKMELFIKSKIKDGFMLELKNNQARRLISLYRGQFPKEEENIKIFDRVGLMTPENIHLNTFMYEPLMDLDDNHLKELYADVKSLV